MRSTVDYLILVTEVRDALDLGEGIVFENYRNVTNDSTAGVVDRRATPPRPSTPEQSPLDRVRFRPDQTCIHRREDRSSTRRTKVCISEYKAAALVRSVFKHMQQVARLTLPPPTSPSRRPRLTNAYRQVQATRVLLSRFRGAGHFGKVVQIVGTYRIANSGGVARRRSLCQANVS